MHLFVRVSLAAILLAACSGTQPPIGAPNATRQRPIAADKSVSYLYVGNDQIPDGQRIDIFRRDDLSRGIVGTIRRRVSEPGGIFVDSAGTLYVADNNDESGHDRVTVYPKGANEPIRIYKGIECATDVVAGADGTVYVADPCGTNGQGRVHVYAPGSTKQIRLLYPGGAPSSVTLDSENRLYVGYTIWPHVAGQVKRYRPGATEGLKLLPDKTVFSIGSIALDNHGALLVANEIGGVIDVFAGIRKPPSRIIKTGQTYPYFFAFDRQENRIYVSSPFYGSLRANSGSGGDNPNTVAELDYASGTVLFTLQPGGYPTGVAVSPSAPF